MKHTASLLFAAIMVLAIGSVSTPGASSKKRGPEEIIRTWKDGPVRYLLGSKEYEDLSSIKSVPELARFITNFWARRDPTPGTFDNEYRREFWQRVAEANRRFRDSTMPGWKTDRGKVYILLGEPDFIESQEEGQKSADRQRLARGPGAPDSGSRGIERWQYKRAYTKIANPEFVVVFTRDESLDWRLSSDPGLLSPMYTSASTSSPYDASFAGVVRSQTPSGVTVPAREAALANPNAEARASQQGLPPVGSETDFALADAAVIANYDLGVEMAVPSNTELVIATVSAREFLSPFAAEPAFEYFRARDGSTFVNIGALLISAQLYGERREGSSDLRIHASLLKAGDAAGPRYASNDKSPMRYDLAEGPPPGGIVALWTGVAVPPGHYAVTIAVEESLGGRLGHGTAEIEVPDYSRPELTLSTPVLASSIAQTGGRMGVTARASKVFRKTEMFGLYYEVYGLGGTEGVTKFDATYRFYRVTETGTSPIGKPIEYPGRAEAVQAWAIPLEAWPPGRYMLQIDIETPSGDSASTTASFEVVE